MFRNRARSYENDNEGENNPQMRRAKDSDGVLDLDKGWVSSNFILRPLSSAVATAIGAAAATQTGISRLAEEREQKEYGPTFFRRICEESALEKTTTEQ